MRQLGGYAADPDARRGGFAEVNGFASGAERHRFVVLAAFDSEFGSGSQLKAIEEFQELAVFFVHANNFSFVFCAKIGEQDRALFAKFSDAATDGDAVRACAVVAETLEEKFFDFRRDGMLETLGFVVGFRPRKADDFGEQNFCELVAERHAFGELAAFAGKIDVAGAVDANEIVAGEALERVGDGGRCDAELFRETRADGRRLPFFEHFPNGFEIVFARDAGLLPLQSLLQRKMLVYRKLCAVVGAQAGRKVFDSSPNVVKSVLVNGRFGAEGIMNVPIFDFVRIFKDAMLFKTTHINDEIDGFPMRMHDGL